MNGSGPGRPGNGESPGKSQGAIAAVVVLVALVAIAFAVVIGIRLGGSYLGEQTATGPVPTSSKATTTRTPPAPRTNSTTSSTTTSSTTTRRATASCDARTINADLGYPGSGARIIDCGSGWAVMASEHSGDPFWVSFGGGRWQAERGISMYLMTCPDEAITQGAPAWLADRHLTCRSTTPPTSTSRASTTRTSGPGPSASPPPRPSPSVVPTTSSSTSSSSTVTSPPISTTETTQATTTTPTGESTADTGRVE